MRTVTYLECRCDSPEHVVRVVYDSNRFEPEEDPELFIEVQMNPWLPWYKRLAIAFRYVFNQREGKHSGWTSTWVSGKSVVALHKTLQTYFIVKNLRKAVREKKARQAAAQETNNG